MSTVLSELAAEKLLLGLEAQARQGVMASYGFLKEAGHSRSDELRVYKADCGCCLAYDVMWANSSTSEPLPRDVARRMLRTAKEALPLDR